MCVKDCIGCVYALHHSRSSCRYGELEEVTFGESLAAVRLPELEEDLDSTVSSLHTFAGATESALSGALERCEQATGT